MAKASKDPGGTSLEAAVASIRKHWGTTSIHTPGEDIKVEVNVLPTGIPPLNDILGNGGIAEGSIVEVYGPEGAGKSTLCLQIIQEAQKRGVKTLFIDQEHALDARYAESIGVCVSDMYIAQPDSMEEALGIAEEMIKTGQIGLVIVDSLASLVPKDELNRTIEEQTMGIQPRLLSTWLRRTNPIIADTGTIVIFTNQLRDKIGGYGGGSTTPGGRAIKFYCTYRLEIRIVEQIRDPKSGMKIGNGLRITATKNKRAFPFQYCDVKLMYGEGIDVIEALIEDAVGFGILLQGGAWYRVSPEVDLGYTKEEVESMKWQGRAALKEAIINDSVFTERLENKVEAYKTGEWPL